MSAANKLLLSLLLIATNVLHANSVGILATEIPVNPFDVKKIQPALKKETPMVESDFCQAIRTRREQDINITADLKPGGAQIPDDAARCFSSSENLLFVANQEAQIIIGPYAPWYLALSIENRERVAEACEVMGFETDRNERAYSNCLENRYKELMGPYENRYRREAMGYISKRKNMARRLVVQCNAALKAKRPVLPRDLVFPVALYDRRINSIPNWMLDEGVLDDIWLKQKGIVKAKNVMQAALGLECPGNMSLWVTYQAPNSDSNLQKD